LVLHPKHRLDLTSHLDPQLDVDLRLKSITHRSRCLYIRCMNVCMHM